MTKELAHQVIDVLTHDLRECQGEPPNGTEDPRHCAECEVAWEARANIIQHMGW